MELPLSDSSPSFILGPFELDAERLLLLHGGEPVALGPKVVETLLALVERAGDVMTKDELLERIWPEGYVEEANLAQNIYVLRKTLARHWQAKPIETIPRRGYRLICDVRRGARPTEGPVELHKPRAFSQRRWTALLAAASILLAVGITAGRPQSSPAQAVALTQQGAGEYELGRYYWNLRTPQSLAKSVKYFARVTRTDPKSAVGYAGLADAYSMIADYNCQRAAACKQTVLKAESYAARALAIDPSSAEAHTSHAMALALSHHGDRRAEDEYRTAIALNPKYALAHQWLGTSLLMRGQMSDARHELEAAIALQPVATATNAWLGTEAYFDHRYADAVSYNRQALEFDPRRMDSLLLLGLSQEQLGQYPQALESFGRFSAICNCKYDAQLLVAGVYARMGRHEDALAALNRALAGSKMLPQDELAIVFIQLGDRSRALSYMRRVHFKDRLERMWLALDPRMDPVRADARFSKWTNAG